MVRLGTSNGFRVRYTPSVTSWSVTLYWELNIKIHLDTMGMADTINDKNQKSNQDHAKAMIFLRHHLDEGLKM